MYTELSTDSEYDLPNPSAPGSEDNPFVDNTVGLDDDHSSPPSYASLSGGTNTPNFTSAGDNTLATNAGPYTTAVGQPTGSSDAGGEQL